MEKEEKIAYEEAAASGKKVVFVLTALSLLFIIAFIYFGFHYLPIEVPQGR
jgi:flagellar biogenesis protein FliO